MAGAMTEELNAIQQIDTWDLVGRPDEKKIISMKWIFKTKYKASGEILKHRERIVVKGYTQ